MVREGFSDAFAPGFGRAVLAPSQGRAWCWQGRGQPGAGGSPGAAPSTSVPKQSPHLFLRAGLWGAAAMLCVGSVGSQPSCRRLPWATRLGGGGCARSSSSSAPFLFFRSTPVGEWVMGQKRRFVAFPPSGAWEGCSDSGRRKEGSWPVVCFLPPPWVLSSGFKGFKTRCQPQPIALPFGVKGANVVPSTGCSSCPARICILGWD